MNQTFKYIKESLTTSYSKDKSLKVKLASLKILFPYLKVHWKKGFIASVFTIIVSLLALPTPYLMKYIVDDVIIAKNIKVLNLLIFLLIVVQLGKLIVSFFTNYLFDIFNKEILVEIKKKLFHCLLKLSLSFFDKNQTGYLLSRLNEVEGLSFFFSSILVRVLISFFEFIFCIGLLFYLSWKLTLISLSILPLYYFATKYYSLGIRKLSREEMEKNANLSRQVQDSLSGVEVIKVFVAEERETERINFYLDELKKVSIKNDIILAFSSELISLVGIVGGLIVLWFSSFEIIRENFTIGSYIAFSAYLAKLYGPTQISATIRLQYQRAITALERITEFMNMTSDQEKEKGVKFKKIKGNIEFKNVYFSYNTKQVLTNINIKIKQKEKILITGPNGSGKSTIGKLILGLYKIQKGKILIDNNEIDKVSLSSLRERISIVSQHTFLFNDTIKNNILYSRPDANEKDLIEASKLSGAYEFIKRLEKGFETIVGERGVKISGGELQKIAIARAILKNSDFIIFDEVTTHLDSESERRIKRLIKNNFDNKTCLIISPKIWNISKIDRIFILKEGNICKEIKPTESY